MTKFRQNTINDPSDSKIRSLLKSSVALHAPPPYGRQLLINKIITQETVCNRSPNLFNAFVAFFQLPTRDPESLALSQTFVISNAWVFSLPGTANLHLT